MINVLAGENFTGKSDFMRTYTGFGSVNDSGLPQSIYRDSRRDLYTGPIPDYFFTGFFNSVQSEIFRFSSYSQLLKTSLEDFIAATIPKINFQQNPFTLSGGEKAMVLLLSMLSSNPRTLAIDCTLEQLSFSWKLKFLDLLDSLHIPEVMLADNRLTEYPKARLREMRYNLTQNEHSNGFDPLQSAIFDPGPSVGKRVLQVRNLSFGYGKTPVFLSAAFNFETGNIYHLKGENGAGKSTLAKILAGVLKPSPDTEILLDDKKADFYKSPGKVFGYSSQQPDEQLFSNSVDVELGLDSSKGNANFGRTIAESFGLGRLIQKHPFELPVSMRKRVSTAANLSTDKPFYIIDEPTLYMDDHNMQELKVMIEKLRDSGKGIIIISHAQSFISKFEKLETIDLNQN